MHEHMGMLCSHVLKVVNEGDSTETHYEEVDR